MNRNSIIVMWVEHGLLCMEGYSSKKWLSRQDGYIYKILRRITKRIWKHDGRVHVRLPINHEGENKTIKIPLDEFKDCKRIDSGVQ